MLPPSLWLFSLIQMKYEMRCSTIYSLKTETATYPLNMLSSSYQDSDFICGDNGVNWKMFPAFSAS